MITCILRPPPHYLPYSPRASVSPCSLNDKKGSNQALWVRLLPPAASIHIFIDTPLLLYSSKIVSLHFHLLKFSMNTPLLERLLLLLFLFSSLQYSLSYRKAIFKRRSRGGTVFCPSLSPHLVYPGVMAGRNVNDRVIIYRTWGWEPGAPFFKEMIF